MHFEGLLLHVALVALAFSRASVMLAGGWFGCLSCHLAPGQPRKLTKAGQSIKRLCGGTARAMNLSNSLDALELRSSHQKIY